MMPVPEALTTPRPVAVGKWTFRRGGMLCRLPLKRLRVSAPSEFLRAVESSCDGRATWDEVRDELIARWPANEVDACLSTLLEQGALVDAGHLLALQAQIGWTPQPLAAPLNDPESLYELRRAAERRLVEPLPGVVKLRPRQTPLMDLLRDRGSARTFDDRALSLQSVVNILWSMYGVSHEGDERIHRTVPSGGALYGLRWFLALLRPMDGYPCGIYEVRHHADGENVGEVSMHRLAGDAMNAWSTLLTPSVLSFAHAVVYPVANLRFISEKYGNRSLTLAMIEAGHALQNGALAAQFEDAATIVRGDTVEMEVLSLLGLAGSFYPLPSMVVGAKPSPAQEKAASKASQAALVRSIPNHSQQLPLATRIAVAGPIQIGGPTGTWALWAAGRSEDARLAAIKAEAEAWERIGWSTPSAAMERARPGEVSGAVDPRSLVHYSQAQYGRQGFSYSPLSARRSYPWVKGQRARDGAEVHLMAHCVHALSSLHPNDASRPFTNASTSGVAAYTDMETAQYRALVELVERDAFARAWLGRLAPPAIEEEGMPGAVRHRLARLRHAGYTASVHALPSGHLPAVAVFVQNVRSTFASITTAAGFAWEEALESALSEAESRVQQQHGTAPHSPMAAEEVVLATHHGDYFRTRAGFRTADWFASAQERVSMHGSQAFPSNGAALLDHFIDSNFDVRVCDLTPPGASIHQGRVPLHVARVFVSGLVPIWFGHGLEPLGLCERMGVNVELGGRPGHPLPLHPCT